jgi:putative ABC transport system substrate-binding protein
VIFATAGAAAWPLGTLAQQAAMPVIGFLQEGSAIPHLLAPFREGLAEACYVEGKNLAIEYRFSKDRPELLPEAVRDLVKLNVNVIFAAGPLAVAAARDAGGRNPEIWRQAGQGQTPQI